MSARGRSIRTVVVVDRLPAGTETFIRRHVDGLGADVFARTMEGPELDDWNPPPYVACVRRGVPRKEPLPAKVLRRAREVAFGIPAPRWTDEDGVAWDRYVEERRPDVVLAEFGPNGIAALDGCRRHGLPLVVHFHGYDASALLRVASYREALPRLFADAAAIVVVSRAMRATLESLGAPTEKVHRIPCGAPAAEIGASAVVAEQPCRFATASSFDPKKGTLLTLRAFAQCHASVSATSLVMVGSGKQFRAAKTLVSQLGLTHAVKFLGHQPSAEVKRVLTTDARVFLQHSLTSGNGSTEGWPVAIAEASAAALPVVATVHAGIPEQVEDGVTGFLVPEGDWQTMAERMITLARDPELRRRMGEAGRRHIAQVGDSAVMLERLRRLLDEVAAGEPAGRPEGSCG